MRADRHVPPVGGLVDVVERCAGVEQVGAALLAPGAAGDEAGQHRVQVGGAVDDRGVDHLPLAAGARLEQRGEHADDEVGRPAAEVAEEVVRDLGRPPGPAQPVQGAGDGDVVDVVPSARRRAGRPGPSRSSARRPARGCGPGTRRGPTPSRSATPGRIPSRSTSAEATRSRTTPAARGSFRSIATLGRPRVSTSLSRATAASVPPGRSMRMTSAPRSASVIAACGPGPIDASSTTRTPRRGPPDAVIPPALPGCAVRGSPAAPRGPSR